MEKINVVKERCIGCGACVAIDSEHFTFDDNGKSECINNDNLESENLINAMESCPTSAIEKITIEDNENSEDGNDCSCNDEDCPCSHEDSNNNCNHEDCLCNHDECECHHKESDNQNN